ncbi:MAG: twin-arginine translocase subunit TatC [Gemmatimonas sp.]
MSGSVQLEMPFLDHLEELRWRLFKCAVAIAICVGLTFAALFSFPEQIDIVGILARPVQPYLKQPLMVTGPGDLFDIVMDASITIGLTLASPVIVWQVWGFLSPALYGHEKKVVIPTLIGAAVLFLAGMSLAFFFVVPVSLRFLILGFQTDSVNSMLTVDRYFSFLFAMCLAFGAVFELPIVILLLTALGIVQPAFLIKFRRHAFVGCILLAALITPGSDPTSLFLLTLPLYFLYEVSIWLSRFVSKRREKRIAGQDTLELA